MDEKYYFVGGYFRDNRSRRERFWAWLGFGPKYDQDLINWRIAEPQGGDWWAPGYVSTHVFVHFDWRDRMRLLLTGDCTVDVFTRTGVPVERADSRSQVAVLPPGSGRRHTVTRGSV